MAAGAAISDAVFGHYMQQGSSWSPALAQSSQLFQSIVTDNVRAIEEEVQQNPMCTNNFYILLYWPADAAATEDADKQQDSAANATASVTVKQRTLLMLAAYHGNLRILSFLLSRGTEPSVKSPDGLSAYDFAVSGGSQNASTVLAMLKDVEGSFNISNSTNTFDPVVSAPPSGARSNFQQAAGGSYGSSLEMPMGAQEFENDPFNADGLPYSTSELTRPEYSTDTFRMFCFKVLRCSKRYAHDWRACPFAHPTENARRRDPREFKYCSTSCPDYKQGFCIRGDTCPYAHGVFESWLHPSRHRTQLCKDGTHCNRPVCFFAHSLSELRTPTYTWVPTPEDLLRPPTVATASPSTSQLSPTGSSCHSPDLVLKAIKTASLPTDAPLHSDSPHALLNPITSQPLLHKPPSHLDLAATALIHPDYLSRLQASSPDTPTSHPYLQKILPIDNHTSSIISSPSYAGSPLPGSPTSSVLSVNTSGMLGGVAAPRMSNAFARKYGLNPRDSPVVNLQKIALAGQVVPTVLPVDSQAPLTKVMQHSKRFSPPSLTQPRMYAAQSHLQHHPQQYQHAAAHLHASAVPEYIAAEPMMQMFAPHQLAAGTPLMHSGWQ